MVLRLCERFHCLPSQVAREDAYLLAMLAIRDRGDPPEEVDGG